MYHPTVKGTYYQMGHEYGTVLYRHGFRITEQSEEKLAFGRKSEEEVKHIFPDILEEMRGFADACHASYENFNAFMMSIGAFKAEPMCSVFAASSDSDVIFGRNYDFFYSFKKITESYMTCPEGGLKSIGHTDIIIGREDGVNEKGIAIAMTGIQGKIIKPGINFPLIIRCILDKCETTKEAVRVLSEAHFSTTSNYLVADRSGDMAVVGASPERIRIRKPEENFMVATNHFVHSEMQEMEDLEKRNTTEWDSIPRYNTISDSLRQHGEKIDISRAQKILSNHTGYMCSHQNKIRLGTIWSIVASLKEPKIFRAEGHPCKTRFEEDMRLKNLLIFPALSQSLNGSGGHDV